MRVCDWGRFTCTSVLHSLKRNRMFIRLIAFIRRDSNSSALPVKEVRAVQRSNNNNIKNAFRLVLPHKLITKSVWYCLTSTCPHFLLRNKGGFLQCSFPVWAIKTKPFLSLPCSVIMADESNVTWKKILPSQILLYWLTSIAGSVYPPHFLGDGIFLNSRLTPKRKEPRVPRYVLKLGCKWCYLDAISKTKQNNDRKPLCAGRQGRPLWHTYSRGLVV